MDEKIRWCLENQFNGRYIDLIISAIKNDNVSLDDFISGYDAIRNAQWDNEEDFTPKEFLT